jgi:hypothetical protein
MASLGGEDNSINSNLNSAEIDGKEDGGRSPFPAKRLQNVDNQRAGRGFAGGLRQDESGEEPARH